MLIFIPPLIFFIVSFFDIDPKCCEGERVMLRLYTPQKTIEHERQCFVAPSWLLLTLAALLKLTRHLLRTD